MNEEKFWDYVHDSIKEKIKQDFISNMLIGPIPEFTLIIQEETDDENF